MKTALIVVGIIAVVLALGALVVTIMDREVRRAVIAGVDLSQVPDGVYTGGFKSGRWHNQVEVTVEDRRIVKIRNTNRLPDARSQDIVDKAIETMLATQSIDIDAISGASLNTRSFQKAVENALTEGLGR